MPRENGGFEALFEGMTWGELALGVAAICAIVVITAATVGSALGVGFYCANTIARLSQ